AIAEKLLRDYPDEPRSYDLLNRAHAELASIFFTTRRFREAEKFYSEAIQRKPNDAMLWFRRAEFYSRLALWDLAAKDAAAAFKLQPSAALHQYFAHAVLSVYVGDVDSYRQLCALIPKRFRPETNYGGGENGLSRACTIGATPEAVRAWAVQ